MSFQVAHDGKKKAGFAPVPARSLPMPRSFEFPNTAGGEKASAAAGHDFGRLPVDAQPMAVASCPLSLASPRACPFGGACHTCPARVQAKLAINRPGDEYEQEADQVADQVIRMPEFSRRFSLSPMKRGTESKGEVSPIVREVLSSPGQSLNADTCALMEQRFGHDFGGVRVHTDEKAAESARAANALAYTLGRDIVFGAGQFAPGTSGGDKLLTHELTHVIQQQKNEFESSVQRIQRTAATCPTDWNTTVGDDHNRALGMIDTARTKLSSYDGTSPPEVKTALDTHFKASSGGFAGWVNINLAFLRRLAPLASYDCEDSSSWWCGPSTNAKTFWCVPFVDIRVCQPNYFGKSDIERSRILIHEWVHKYGCNFDLGYRHNPDYPKQWTVTALLNADPFAQFVKDVQ